LGELSLWNVAFFGTQDGRSVALCEGLNIRTSDRGRDPDRTRGLVVSLGDHINTTAHKAIDLPTNPNPRQPARIWRDRQDPRRPLLMIYLINKNSIADAKGKRENLNIVEDFVGIGICFPSSNHDTPEGYVEVILPALADDGGDDDFDATEVDAEGSADDIRSVGRA
jgi:hypothetical protein